MGYEVNYYNLNGQDKRDKAILDIKDYIGKRRFGIVGAIAMEAHTYMELSFQLSFAGVQGYPVVALWEETRQEMKYMSE